MVVITLLNSFFQSYPSALDMMRYPVFGINPVRLSETDLLSLISIPSVSLPIRIRRLIVKFERRIVSSNCIASFGMNSTGLSVSPSMNPPFHSTLPVFTTRLVHWVIPECTVIVTPL